MATAFNRSYTLGVFPSLYAIAVPASPRHPSSSYPQTTTGQSDLSSCRCCSPAHLVWPILNVLYHARSFSHSLSIICLPLIAPFCSMSCECCHLHRSPLICSNCFRSTSLFSTSFRNNSTHHL